MGKNRTYEQKRLASQPAGAKCVRPVRSFAETGTMYVDFNVIAQIKEDSP
jgi:hypothetical protein